jgi:CRP-like cAMP-binding protein
LPSGGIERQAIEAGEVDAIVDYAGSNIIVLATARRALRRIAAVTNAQRDNDGPRVANAVLAALPREVYEQLAPGLEPVRLEFGQVLHEQGAAFRYVYFPIDCVVCLLAAADGKRTAATGVVGYEGMIGMSLVFGVEAAPVHVKVLAAGAAMRMPAERFRMELSRCPPLQRALYHYAYLELAQAIHMIACMSYARMEQRVASMILNIADRSKSRDVFLTHDCLAATFRVRRVSITLAAATLRARKLISYNRGAIRILNRQGLEAAACSCYKGQG